MPSEHSGLSNPTVKETNPKDAIGASKPRFWSGISWHVLREVTIAFFEGALKYGRHNYRPAGVRYSIYFDAALDHLTKWYEGEDIDRDTSPPVIDQDGNIVQGTEFNGIGLHHVTKAICCLIVVRDSMITGNDVDDRPPINAGPEQLENLKLVMDGLKKRYPKPEMPYTQRELYRFNRPRPAETGSTQGEKDEARRT